MSCVSAHRLARCVAVMMLVTMCCCRRESGESQQDQTPQKSSDSQSAPQFHFTDITDHSGIAFNMTCGDMPASFILEVNGGGLSLIDFDNDGRLDLFVANGATMADPEHGPGCRLYRNVSSIDRIQFEDVTEAARIRVRRWGTGVAVGDYNGDGFDDLYICCYGDNILLRNNGDGTFADVTDETFEDAMTKTSLPQWSTSAAFGDLDGDGDLDLYVCNYLDFDIANPPPPSMFRDVQVMAGPHGLPPQHDVLFENMGGKFRDASESSGIRAVQASFGLNVAIVDFDGDGKQDITVANDSMPDFLFHNVSDTSLPPPTHNANSTLRFHEIGVISGIASNRHGANQASMGIAIGDLDGSGTPDKFTTVFSSDVNALHVNRGTTSAKDLLSFDDRAQQYGLAMVSRQYLGWSTGFYDFDLDGDEDLFMVNGHVYPQASRTTMDSDFPQPPLLFQRQGERFKPVTTTRAGDWLMTPRHGRNAVFADLDNDGDIDIVTGELNGPIRTLRNDCIREEKSEVHKSKIQKEHVDFGDSDFGLLRQWLTVALHDGRAGSMNRRGLGAKIEIEPEPQEQSKSQITNVQRDNVDFGALDSGSLRGRQTRWLFTGGGFQSSGMPMVHVGLGRVAADATVRVTVTWPDGDVQVMKGVKANQRLLIERR